MKQKKDIKIENFKLDYWIGLSIIFFLLLVIVFLISKLFLISFPYFIKIILLLFMLFCAYVYFFNYGKPLLKSLKFIKNSKDFIYIIIGIFVIFATLGFFIPVPEALSEKIFELLKELLEKTKDMGYFELMRFIFLNNLQSSFLGMILGVFFGFFSVLMAVANGYLLGFVSLLSVGSEGISVLLRLFPHGIFELPAVFISLGLGLRLGILIFQHRKNKKKPFKEYLLNSLRVFLFVVLPLLIIAAIIETSLIFAFS